MTISEQLTALRTALADWAKASGSTIAIAADAVHLWHLLASKPGAVRGVLLFDAEEKRGEYEELGRVDRKYLLVLSRGRGFTMERSDNLTQGSAGGKALFDLVEEAREILRRQRLEPGLGEWQVNYLRSSRFDSGDAIVDAYQVEFIVPSQLPVYEE